MTENAFYPLFVLVCARARADARAADRRRQSSCSCSAASPTRRARRRSRSSPAALVAPAAARRGSSATCAGGCARSRRSTAIVGGGRCWSRSAAPSRAAARRSRCSAPTARRRPRLLRLAASRTTCSGTSPSSTSTSASSRSRRCSRSGSRRVAAARGARVRRASLPIVVLLVAEVAAFASQQSVADRGAEHVLRRAARARRARRLAMRPCRAAAARRCSSAGGGRGRALPVFIPFARFITTSAVSDTSALLPWWWVQDHWHPLDDAPLGRAAPSRRRRRRSSSCPRRLALVLPALVGGYFVCQRRSSSRTAATGSAQASVGSLWAGIKRDASRLDRPAPSGRDADVAFVWTARVRRVRDLGERVLQPQRQHGLRPSTAPIAGRPARDAACTFARRPPGRLRAVVSSARELRARDDTADIEGNGRRARPGDRASTLVPRRTGRSSSRRSVTGIYPATRGRAGAVATARSTAPAGV